MAAKLPPLEEPPSHLARRADHCIERKKVLAPEAHPIRKTQTFACVQVSMTFSELTTKIYQTFTDSAPDWRVVTAGLNLEAECKTSGCRAKGERVWVQLGKGTYNVAMEIFKTHCPMCHGKTQTATNVRFTNCSYRIDGMKKNPDKEVKDDGTVYAGQLLTYKGGVSDWYYLNITTS